MSETCDCELRNRAWDPNTLRCRSCGRRSVDARPGKPMVLVDTCYGMTGGDLFACRTCRARTISLSRASTPLCPNCKEGDHA